MRTKQAKETDIRREFSLFLSLGCPFGCGKRFEAAAIDSLSFLISHNNLQSICYMQRQNQVDASSGITSSDSITQSPLPSQRLSTIVTCCTLLRYCVTLRWPIRLRKISYKRKYKMQRAERRLHKFNCRASQQ